MVYAPHLESWVGKDDPGVCADRVDQQRKSSVSSEDAFSGMGPTVTFQFKGMGLFQELWALKHHQTCLASESLAPQGHCASRRPGDRDPTAQGSHTGLCARVLDPAPPGPCALPALRAPGSRTRPVTHPESRPASAHPTPRGARLVHARRHVTPPGQPASPDLGIKRGPATVAAGERRGRERDSPAPVPRFPLRFPPPPPPRNHVRGEAQGGSEDGERSHQPEGGRTGWLGGAVQDQEAHSAEQADEGLLRAAGLVNEADSIPV